MDIDGDILPPLEGTGKMVDPKIVAQASERTVWGRKSFIRWYLNFLSVSKELVTAVIRSPGPGYKPLTGAENNPKALVNP